METIIQLHIQVMPAVQQAHQVDQVMKYQIMQVQIDQRLVLVGAGAWNNCQNIGGGSGWNEPGPTTVH